MQALSYFPYIVFQGCFLILSIDEARSTKLFGFGADWKNLGLAGLWLRIQNLGLFSLRNISQVAKGLQRQLPVATNCEVMVLR